MSSTLFDDLFKITDIENGEYDKVSRITAQSQSSQDIKLTLDINHDLFPIKQDQVLTVALASTLNLDGSVSMDSWRPPRDGDARTLADDYDYVMHGTVYKFDEGKDNDNLLVYVSFGGLLMCLEGGYRSLSSLKQDKIYLLIRA